MANTLYNIGLQKLCNASYNWDTDTVHVAAALFRTAAFTFDKTDATMSAISATEESNSSYTDEGPNTDGRITADNTERPAVAIDVAPSPDEIQLKIDDNSLTWTGISNGAATVIPILYIGGSAGDGGIAASADATNLPLAHIDTGTNIPITPNGGDITLNFANEVFIAFSAPAFGGD